MNILRKELRLGFKPFMLWIIGLFILDVAGLIKFTGVSEGGASMSAIVDQIPRVVQALIGIVGINIESLSGYYSILGYFVMLCACIYAMFLASNAVNREIVDKTYEFIFTKPRSRGYILSMKLIAGMIYLTLFAVLNILFSYAGLSLLNIKEAITNEILYYSLAIYLVSSLYYAITTLILTILNRPEKGTLYSNIFFFATFVIGVGVDMLEKPGLLRVFAPLKYFTPVEIINGNFNVAYAIVSIVCISLCVIFAYQYFNKKDFKAVN